MVKVVTWAAGNGDRSENGDYIYGKKRLREIDRRIRFPQQAAGQRRGGRPGQARPGPTRCSSAPPSPTPMREDEERTITIVGVDEADLAKGHVSWISPIARALLRAAEGDVVKLRTPAGVEEIEIVKVEYR